MNKKENKIDIEELNKIKKKNKLVIIISCIMFIIIIGLILIMLNKNNNSGLPILNKSKTKIEELLEFNTAVEEQYDSLLTKYLKYDYLYISEYDLLARYPIAYNDTIVKFYGTVVKVLEEKGDNYKILVDMQDDSSIYFPEENNYIVIEGKYDKKRYIKGDYIEVYGVFKGNDTYKINNSDEVLPKIIVNRVVIADASGEVIEYDYDDIRQIAKEFFNTSEFTVVQPNYNFLDEKEAYLMGLPFHFIVKLDNQSNGRFNSYRFFSCCGVIQVATEHEDGEIERTISKSTDNKHYILTNYTKRQGYLELQMYDENFKQIWTRTFEETEKYIIDNNNGKIAINVNSDLYVINEKNGKDIIAPTMVGPGLSLKLLKNGDIIFISSNKNNFTEYITKDGKIKWKENCSFTPNRVSNILVANDKIYVNYSIENNDTLYIMVFSKDGEVLSDTFSG